MDIDDLADIYAVRQRGRMLENQGEARLQSSLAASIARREAEIARSRQRRERASKQFLFDVSLEVSKNIELADSNNPQACLNMLHLRDLVVRAGGLDASMFDELDWKQKCADVTSQLETFLGRSWSSLSSEETAAVSEALERARMEIRNAEDEEIARKVAERRAEAVRKNRKEGRQLFMILGGMFSVAAFCVFLIYLIFF